MSRGKQQVIPHALPRDVLLGMRREAAAPTADSFTAFMDGFVDAEDESVAPEPVDQEAVHEKRGRGRPRKVD